MSFIYHPLVIYLALWGLYALLHRLIKKEYHPGPAGLWIALTIVAINFVVKNVALIMGVDLMPII